MSARWTFFLRGASIIILCLLSIFPFLEDYRRGGSRLSLKTPHHPPGRGEGHVIGLMPQCLILLHSSDRSPSTEADAPDRAVVLAAAFSFSAVVTQVTTETNFFLFCFSILEKV